MHRGGAIIALVSLTSAAILAGCVAEEETTAVTCDFQTVIYSQSIDRAGFRELVTQQGYEWHPQENDIVVLVPPEERAEGVRGLLSNESTSSGGGTTITATETEDFGPVPGGQGRVGTVVRDLTQAANLTLDEEPQIDQWIAGSHAECPGSDVTRVNADLVDLLRPGTLQGADPSTSV